MRKCILTSLLMSTLKKARGVYFMSVEWLDVMTKSLS